MLCNCISKFHPRVYSCSYQGMLCANPRIGGLSMIVDKIALLLAIVGALNWGGIGLFGFDTVAFLFGGQMAILSRIVYTLVGLAGLWCITLLFRDREEHGHTASA